MYCVFVTNHKTQIQTLLHETIWVDDAAQICEEKALELVFSKEGINYSTNLKKNLNLKKRQKFLPEGYSVVKSKCHIPKYTVFHKEKNGYLSYGALTKLFTFFVVKYPNNCILTRESELSAVWKETLDTTLSVFENDCFELEHDDKPCYKIAVNNKKKDDELN